MPNGKRYIVPFWIEIDSYISYDDAKKLIPKELLESKPNFEVFDVPGRPYTIMVQAGRISCSCPGFKFKHKCKHTKAFEETHAAKS